jgi:hypothetical protein
VHEPEALHAEEQGVSYHTESIYYALRNPIDEAFKVSGWTENLANTKAEVDALG